MKVLPYIDEAIEDGTLTKPLVLERGERKTIVDKGIVVQIHYGETNDRFGKMVSHRTTTMHGRTISELFDPPIIETGLPPLPLAASGGNGAGRRFDETKRRPAAGSRGERKSKIFRLQQALGGARRRRKSD
jgi:hypothetical protein